MGAVDGYSVKQVRAAERPLIAAGEPLMQRAADALAAVVEELLGARAGGSGDASADPAVTRVAGTGHVLALVGSGDNGGDALLACARLAMSGHAVTAALLGSRVHQAGLAAARAAGVQVLERGAATASSVGPLAARSDVVLDGLLGIGAAGPLRSPAREAVEAVAATARTVVAVDLPSGVDADTGEAPPPVLRAAVTVAFGAVKAGLLREPAATLAGRLVLADIGLGPELAGVRPVLPGDA